MWLQHLLHVQHARRERLLSDPLNRWRVACLQKWLAGLLAGQLAGQLAGLLAGLHAGQLAGLLAGRLAGQLAGLLLRHRARAAAERSVSSRGVRHMQGFSQMLHCLW
jgi:purine-cytosine permease-like protein